MKPDYSFKKFKRLKSTVDRISKN